MGRKGGRGGRGAGPQEDQYGEAFVSQDRDGGFAPVGGRGGGRMSGGGEAGGSKAGSNVSYVKHVPKFLQAHIHLLGGKKRHAAAEEDPAVLNALEDEQTAQDAQNEEEEALQRAIAENPALALEHPELTKLANKAKAAEEKEKGNKAFGHKRYDDAVTHFTVCIELDPGNEVYYSNRSAAYAALKQFRWAVRDAKKVIELKPTWVKGWARLGAAHMGLEDFSEAREAYDKALDIEPDDQALQQAQHRADTAERRAAAERKHKFKQKHGDEPAKPAATKKAKVVSIAAAGVKNKGLLSFQDDE
ncbi:hypothetical protein WJX72_012158 [[Myrmecia] bisecta]|uniref:Uncharacterized protein n=1 Tax=[Myrmecia] bisecta TaxID=41462 RepID=A0AAW1RA13_9CHLO